MRLEGDIEGMTSAPEALMVLAYNHPKLLAESFRQMHDSIYSSKEFNNHKYSLKILDMGPARSNSHVIIVTILTVSRL